MENPLRLRGSDGKKTKFETNNRNQYDEMAQMCIAHAAARLQRFRRVILNVFDYDVIVILRNHFYNAKNLKLMKRNPFAERHLIFSPINEHDMFSIKRNR